MNGFYRICKRLYDHREFSKRKEAGSMLELLFLLILGILMLFKPELLWKIEHMFKVKMENRRSCIWLLCVLEGHSSL